MFEKTFRKKCAHLKTLHIIDPWPPFAIFVRFSWQMSGARFAEVRDFIQNQHSPFKEQNLRCKSTESQITWDFGEAWAIDSYAARVTKLNEQDELSVSISMFPRCTEHQKILPALAALNNRDGIEVSEIEICLDGDGVWGYIRNIERTILNKILTCSKIIASPSVTDASNGWNNCTKEYSIVVVNDVLQIL